jgi:hypothetical protein
VWQPRQARAEDAVTYKFQDYVEDGGRVGVRVQSALFEKDLTPDLRIKFQGVVDAIAGATPTGEPADTPGGPVPLTQMHDRRKAWNAEAARQFPRINLALGFAHSRESDYTSNGLSLNSVTDFNQKNTQLALGLAGTDDDVKVFYRPEWERKRGLEFLVGVNQVVDPQTAVSVNLTFSRSRGYLGDPYRIIRQNTEVLPGLLLPLIFSENRPRSRDRWILFGSVNHAFKAADAALDASYRLTHDDFGMTTHTVAAAWLQQLGERVVLSPSVRYYQQNAADFYFVSLDRAPFAASRVPTGAAPYYSSDYRLTRLRSISLGLKAVWTISPRLAVDAAYERYQMKGLDGTTSRSAFPSADILTVGAKVSF